MKLLKNVMKEKRNELIMNEEIKKILKRLKNISTPTGISYSGDITINNDDVKILEDYITNLQQRVEQLENIRKEAIGYVTSYESISTIQGLDDIEKNKNLDEKTMNEMINRYLKVHDILLNILNKGDNK